MKTLKSVIFISFLAIIIYSQFGNISNLIYLNNTKEIVEINQVVSVYKSSNINNESIDLKEIDYINLAIPIVDSILHIENRMKFDVLLNEGDCSGKTHQIGRVIKLYDCPDHYLPFVHEYLHIIFGTYRELWFFEGIATYLSLLITSESLLKKYDDTNTAFFFDAWYTDSNSTIDWNKRNELSYIDDLKIKYNRAEIESILRFNDKISFLSLNDPIEFHRLSSSFCEFISKTIGQEKLIALAKKRSYFNDLILDT